MGGSASCDASLLPEMESWIGKNNRESLAVPLLSFREALQTLKILRKYTGKLWLTRKKAAAGTAPQQVWTHLASTLVPRNEGFARDAAAALLLHVATSGEEQEEPYLPAAIVLRSLAPRERVGRRTAVSAPARADPATPGPGSGLLRQQQSRPDRPVGRMHCRSAADSVA